MVTTATEHSPWQQAWISVNEWKDSASDPLYCRGRGFVDPSAPWGRQSSYRSELSKCSLSCVAMGTSAFDGPCIRDSAESFSHGRIRLKGKVFLWLFSGHPPGSYLLMASLDQQDNKNTWETHIQLTGTQQKVGGAWLACQMSLNPFRYELHLSGIACMELVPVLSIWLALVLVVYLAAILSSWLAPVLGMFEHQNRVINLEGGAKFDWHDSDNVPLGKEEKCSPINLLDRKREGSVRS